MVSAAMLVIAILVRSRFKSAFSFLRRPSISSSFSFAAKSSAFALSSATISSFASSHAIWSARPSSRPLRESLSLTEALMESISSFAAAASAFRGGYGPGEAEGSRLDLGVYGAEPLAPPSSRRRR